MIRVDPDELRRWVERGLVAPEAVGLAPVAPPDEAGDEKAFQAQVVKEAKRQGWLVSHAYDSRKSAAGVPDLLLVRERVIWLELKSERGKTTPDQDDWINALRRAGQDVRVYRPRDWPAIVAALAGGGT